MVLIQAHFLKLVNGGIEPTTFLGFQHRAYL